MIYTKLNIGDHVPNREARGIATPTPAMRDGVPACAWFALRVAPGRETAAIRMLGRDGVYAFCPMETRAWFVRGQRFTRDVPTVSQVVYARFRYQPRWDVLKDRRIISGVFCIGNRPIVLPKDAIRVLQGLPVKAEQIAEAKAAMMRVHPGDAVRLLEGPLAGMVVDVTKARDGRVWWSSILANGVPVKGELGRDGVEKLGLAR